MTPPQPSPGPANLSSIRAKLARLQGQHYWRSLDEIARTDEFQEMLQREFPPGASEWSDGVSRREFLQLAGASLVLAGMTACTKQPVQQILPYVKQPDLLVLGEPLFYATSMVLGGFATGVLVKSREGHPIKVEGNPDHPSSLGASSIWMQASLLDLYDPDRSQAVAYSGDVSSWTLFLADLGNLRTELKSTRGAGLRFLTETVTSPTLATQLRDLLQRHPEAKWHQFDPVSRDYVREGARLAFGKRVEAHYQFDRAKVVLSLDSDFLYSHPDRLRHTRQFTDGRRVSAGHQSMNRLYVLESTPTVTGTMADHRLPMTSAEIEEFTRALAGRLGAPVQTTQTHLAAPASRWLEVLVRDLQANRGASAIIAGPWQPPSVHVLVHFLNQALGNVGNTVRYSDSAEAEPTNQLDSLRELAQEMNAGRVDTLFILGGNPAYTAPADFGFGEALNRVKRSIHLGLDLDETAARCTWHIPQTHYLETWGDARAFDGTCSLIQPLIAPLYDGKSAHELVDVLANPELTRSDYEIVRAFWESEKRWPDFEKGWRRALNDGLIAGTALPNQEMAQAGALENAVRNLPSTARSPVAGLEVVFRPDPCIWDGRFANNAWLQECAKPVNKLTWDNAVLISPALAERFNLEMSDAVEITLNHRTVAGPVWIMPGQAENSITLHLGFGRERIGHVGNGVGFDVYPLRTSASFWQGAGATLRKTGARSELVTTQMHHNVHSPDRQVYRKGTLAQFQADPEFVKKSSESPEQDETLYEPGEYKYDGYKWAMSIDLTTCIGCNACLLACNFENNIPAVGKSQVKLNREMYWIRIDTYYQGSLDNPEFNHQPVPCMHCEHAPCELVCPVEATVHDHEGLNLMVYNRCVGTRFCSNNCPYKVRRFNFLRYTDYHTPNLKPMYNPEVTVRWRGVMEKCSYCVQRIAAARIRAEKENRPIRDGEVQTACQQACPAQAIVFGDLNAPQSKVARLKTHPLDYPMLGNLNVRPRTTYLAKLQNRNPELQGDRPV